MNLPDELARWPTDPYDLLDVEQNIGARDLRRAYTRLIKIYKPEHAPEQFRRLREAYEAICKHLEWRERYDVHVESPRAEPDNAPDNSNDPPPAEEQDEAVESASRPAVDELAAEETSANSEPDAREEQEETGESSEQPETDSKPDKLAADEDSTTCDQPPAPAPRPARTIVTDPLRDAWQLALDSRPELAFAQLKSFAAQHGMTPAVAVRLYWLLVTFPELDPKVHPHSILARGLQNNGWDTPLSILYRRELLENPAEAESQRCEQLLAAAPTYLLGDWLPIRWRAVLLKDRWDLVQLDLVRFRPVILSTNEHQWAALLFTALDQLAWSQDPRAGELFQQCREELDSFTHLQLPLSNAYDRADLLCELRESYAELVNESDVPTALKKLLAECWTTPYVQLRTKLAHLAQWLAQQPQAGLKNLDRVHAISKSLLGQLNEALRRFVYHEGTDSDTEADPELLCELTALFLARNKVWYYHDLRQPLLAFCLRHGVLCEELVAYGSTLLENFRLGNGDLLLAKLTEDLPLHCACYAQRAYHG